MKTRAKTALALKLIRTLKLYEFARFLESRSLPAEETLGFSERDQAKVLASIRRRRFNVPRNAPSSLELLREDRMRKDD